MKRLTISKLMDEYTDTEFFPTGGSAADKEAVKARVLADAKPADKKPMPKKKKALLMAAMAAVMVVLVGAGLPSIIYQLPNGMVRFDQSVDGRSRTISSNGPFLDVEDGRVISLLDGGHEDITDRISADTPYIVDRSDPDAGIACYVIMGGTPEYCGSFEWIVTPNPFAPADGNPAACTQGAAVEGVQFAYSYDTYRQDVNEYGELDAYRSSRLGMDTVTWNEGEEVPAWLLYAMDELDIPYEFISPEDITIIHG